jgi:hypothetical protein
MIHHKDTKETQRKTEEFLNSSILCVSFVFFVSLW